MLLKSISLGLGAALAKHYARPGITLFLSARNTDRLKEVASACWKKGADVHIAPMSVTEAASMESWVRECDKKAPIDLVIANAGVSGMNLTPPPGSSSNCQGASPAAASGTCVV